jgi:hypothetical protein
MKKITAITMSPGAVARAAYGTAWPPRRALTIPPARGDEDKEERAQGLCEQAPAFVAAVPEVDLSDDRVRLPDGPQDDVGPLNRPLPARAAASGRRRAGGMASGET